MKILLINPYIISMTPTSLSEPLGLISLATYLDSFSSSDILVEVLDLYALGAGNILKKENKYIMGTNDQQEIIERIRTFAPDIIGIHCNFSMYSEGVFEVVTVAKKACPHTPLVMGGAHTSLDAKKIMKECKDIDFIVRGEGEITFEKLIMSIKDNEVNSCKSIDGLCYRRADGKIIINPDQELISDLDNLPIPDRKFVDMNFYKRINRQTFGFSKNSPLVTMITSRGCPFNCIFCSTKIMWKQRWRAMKAERVIQEIEKLIQDYNAKEICILDDQFLLDKERVHKICDCLIENNTKISLSIPQGGSIWLIDEPLMRKLKQAGFYRFNFPVESGNKKTLQFIRKPIKLEDVKEKIRLANRLGFWTSGNFIIGFPYETKEEMLETIKFAYCSKLDFSLFLIAKPFPGTEMTEIFVKNGLLKKQTCVSDLLVSTHNITTMTSSELQQIHRNAVRGYILRKILFLLNPWNFFVHFWPKINTLDGIHYAIKVLLAGCFRVFIPGLMKRTLRIGGPIK